MKYLIILSMLFSLNSFAKKEQKFYESIYKKHSWNIFLYMCERTAECLGGIDLNGWGQHDEKKGDNKHSCILREYDWDGRTIKVTNIEKLLTLYAECRAKNVNLLDKRYE